RFVPLGAWAAADEISVPGTMIGPSRKIVLGEVALSHASRVGCLSSSGGLELQSKFCMAARNSVCCACVSFLYASSFCGIGNFKPATGLADSPVADGDADGVGVALFAGEVAGFDDGVVDGAANGRAAFACPDLVALPVACGADVLGVGAGVVAAPDGLAVAEPDVPALGSVTGGMTTGRKFNLAAAPMFERSLALLPGMEMTIWSFPWMATVGSATP